MKVLFLDPEQYVDYLDEPSNIELRLPILHCGEVTEHRDLVYQRALRTHGHEATYRMILNEIFTFRPDVVVYSSTWPHENISSRILQYILSLDIPVLTHLWDTHLETAAHEVELCYSSTSVSIADSFSNTEKFRGLIGQAPYLREVFCSAGNMVFPEIFHRLPREKTYDVTIIGSNEGHRMQLLSYLREQLAASGFTLNKQGGLVDNTRACAEAGLSDQFVPVAEYVELINRSKICLSSQTQSTRNQIKGKVFHYLACGAFCLTDDNPELRAMIPGDGVVVYYHSIEECLEKIIYYLTHDDEREAIAARGHAWFHQQFNYRQFWAERLRRMTRREAVV